MALTFIYGSSGSGKSEQLFRMILHDAERESDRQFFLIVPEQFTLQAQKEMVRRSSHGVITNVDVVSFERLAFRVFEELGMHTPILDDTGKNLLLRQLAEEHKEDLTVLRTSIDRMGYIDQIKSILSELMQYDVGPEQLDQLLEQDGTQDSLYYRLHDLSIIYHAFLDRLSGTGLTAEQLPDALRKAVPRSHILKDAVLAFDGFTGFTPVQISLLEELMKTADRMYITVTFDARENILQKERIEDLFYMSRKMVHRVSDLAEKTGFGIDEPIRLLQQDSGRFVSNPVLDHLEKNLFRSNVQSFAGDPADSISVISCQNPKQELETACRRIAELVRSRGLHYADFAIVSGNVELYDIYAEDVFSKYELPYFTDRKRVVRYHPLTELIHGALEIISTNYSLESVFRLLNTGLTDLTAEEIDRLDNYCLARGIRGRKKWEREFHFPMKRNRRLRYTDANREERFLSEELDRLNESRQKLVDLMRPFCALFSAGRARVFDISHGLYKLMTDCCAEEKLEAKSRELKDSGKESEGDIFHQVYRIVVDLMDRFVDLMGETELTSEEYAEIFEAGLQGARVGVIPPGNDCVLLGDIERTRIEGVRYLFFVGVNDGIVPKSADNGGILSQYDRERLKRDFGLELAPTPRESVFIQRFYLYWSLTKPSDGLALSYARTDRDGSPIRPSYLIETICSMFPNLTVGILEEGISGFPLTPGGSLDQYVSGLQQLEKSGQNPVWRALHQWYNRSSLWRSQVRTLFQAHFKKPAVPSLKPHEAARLYGTNLMCSVSRLEMFAQCPYRHFLTFGLKLGERPLTDLKERDLGSCYHDILRRFSQKLSDYDLWPVNSLARLNGSLMTDQIRSLLDESIEEFELSQPDSVLFDSARNEYRIQMIRSTINTMADVMLSQVAAGDFRPEYFEESFRLEQEISDVNSENERGDAAQICLNGMIDRVDVLQDEDRTYLRIIDYKMGRRSFSLDEFYYGLQMQLIFYLDAVMESMKRKNMQGEPAAVFYSHIDDPLIDVDSVDEAYIRQGVLKEMKWTGLLDNSCGLRMDHDAEQNKYSYIIPFGINMDGSFSKSESSVSQNEFRSLICYARKMTRRIAGEILDGEISIHPYRMNKKNSCEYCPYHEICGFDDRIDGYEWNDLEKLSKESIKEKIKEEAGDHAQLDEGTESSH